MGAFREGLLCLSIMLLALEKLPFDLHRPNRVTYLPYFASLGVVPYDRSYLHCARISA